MKKSRSSSSGRSGSKLHKPEVAWVAFGRLYLWRSGVWGNRDSDQTRGNPRCGPEAKRKKVWNSIPPVEGESKERAGCSSICKL